MPGFNSSSIINFFLYGGLNLIKIEKYFVNFFNVKLKRITKENVHRESELEKNFNSSLGAIKIIKDGWETEAIPKPKDKSIQKASFFAKIFGIGR